MVDEPEAERLDEHGEEEGGPVKSFLEHLEDLRWVLIKSLVGLAIGVLICLIAGDKVVWILKRPLERAALSYPGTNQVATVFFGSNQLGVFPLSPEQQGALQLGTNRFVAMAIEPAISGTNRVITWNVDPNPEHAERAKHPNISLINLGPAQGFFVAFQVAMYAGIVLASPFIFYFVAAFVFPALKMKERKYVY